MNKAIMELKALVLNVKDVDVSILFYQRLGFRFLNYSETNHYRSAIMAFRRNSDFQIELRMPITDEGHFETPFLEFVPTGPDQKDANNTWDELVLRGIDVVNMTPVDITCGEMPDKAEIIDPNGHRLIVVLEIEQDEEYEYVE